MKSMKTKKTLGHLIEKIQPIKKEETGILIGGFIQAYNSSNCYNSKCNNGEDCSTTSNGDCCNDNICYY